MGKRKKLAAVKAAKKAKAVVRKPRKAGRKGKKKGLQEFAEGVAPARSADAYLIPEVPSDEYPVELTEPAAVKRPAAGAVEPALVVPYIRAWPSRMAPQAASEIDLVSRVERMLAIRSKVGVERVVQRGLSSRLKGGK
jgi:hypothetical protein